MTQDTYNEEELRAKTKADAEAATSDDAADDANAEANDCANGASDANAEAAAESERYLRLLAEFQNYKKRATKEKADIHAYANEKLIAELLPVLDNFERALATPSGADSEAYTKGMSMIFEQLRTALTGAGLTEIEALGQDFNPSWHSAVMNDANSEYESGKVSKVLQKGYSLYGRVVRPAMVAVAE